MSFACVLCELITASYGTFVIEFLAATSRGFAATARFCFASARRTRIAAAAAASATLEKALQHALERAFAARCTASGFACRCGTAACSGTEVRSRRHASRAAARCWAANFDGNLLADDAWHALGDRVRFADLAALSDLDALGVALFAARGFADGLGAALGNHLANLVGANFRSALGNHLAGGVVASLGARLASVAGADRVVAGLGAALGNHFARRVVANLGAGFRKPYCKPCSKVPSFGTQEPSCRRCSCRSWCGTREPCGKRCSCKPWCGTREPYGKRCKEPHGCGTHDDIVCKSTSFCSQVGTQTFLQIVFGGH